MLERISRVIKSRKISASQFADDIGVQRSSVSHVLSGRNKPSLDFVTKILSAYADINPGWLLTGSGQMYIGEDSNSARVREEEKVEGDTSQLSLNVGRDEEKPVYGQKKTGISKTVAGSSGLERIVILYKDGSYEEFTSTKDS
jgi:transcriptional regulator with XRE-family HTH domain